MVDHSAAFRSSFGAIGERLGFPLRQVDLGWLRTVTEMLKPLGVTTGRAAALFYIERNPGCSQARLGKALGINRPSTARAVDELQAIGAVERRKLTSTSRDNALHLTPGGEDLHRRITDITLAHEEAFFAPLTPTERERFRQLMLKLL